MSKNQINGKITGSINTKLLPENLPETISEYFYYQGYVNGLELALKTKDETQIKALIDVYSAKTAYINKLIKD